VDVSKLLALLDTINNIDMLVDDLAKYDYSPITQDEVFKEIFEQAENFRKFQKW